MSINDRAPHLAHLRRTINAASHKMNGQGYGFDANAAQELETNIGRSLELMDVIEFNLDQLDIHAAVQRLTQIFNTINGMAFVNVIRNICKMHYIDLAEIYSVRIGHSCSQNEFAATIAQGMLLEGHVMLMVDVFGLNVNVLDVRTVGQQQSDGQRIAVNRFVTINNSIENLQNVITLFQSDGHYDLLIRRSD